MMKKQIRVILLMKKRMMMTDNKTTPEQFVEEWLPDFKERYLDYFEVDIDDDMSLEYQLEYPDWIHNHFHEALAAFACHVWDQACREQREMCAQAYIDYNGEDFDHETVSEAIYLAPAPEFKLTEKE